MVLELVLQALGSAASGFLGALAAGRGGACHCIFSASPDAGLLDILREQLARCGPEKLQSQCPVCPRCPERRCPTPALIDGASLFLGLVLGICCAVAVLWVTRCGAVGLPEPVVREATFEARARPVIESPLLRGVTPVTPASRRALLDGSSGGYA